MPPYISPWGEFGNVLNFSSLSALSLLVLIPFMIGWIIVALAVPLLFFWPAFWR